MKLDQFKPQDILAFSFGEPLYLIEQANEEAYNYAEQCIINATQCIAPISMTAFQLSSYNKLQKEKNFNTENLLTNSSSFLETFIVQGKIPFALKHSLIEFVGEGGSGKTHACYNIAAQFLFDERNKKSPVVWIDTDLKFDILRFHFILKHKIMSYNNQQNPKSKEDYINNEKICFSLLKTLEKRVLIFRPQTLSNLIEILDCLLSHYKFASICLMASYEKEKNDINENNNGYCDGLLIVDSIASIIRSEIATRAAGKTFLQKEDIEKQKPCHEKADNYSHDVSDNANNYDDDESNSEKALKKKMQYKNAQGCDNSAITNQTNHNINCKTEKLGTEFNNKKLLKCCLTKFKSVHCLKFQIYDQLKRLCMHPCFLLQKTDVKPAVTWTIIVANQISTVVDKTLDSFTTKIHDASSYDTNNDDDDEQCTMINDHHNDSIITVEEPITDKVCNTERRVFPYTSDIFSTSTSVVRPALGLSWFHLLDTRLRFLTFLNNKKEHANRKYDRRKVVIEKNCFFSSGSSDVFTITPYGFERTY